LLVDSVIINDVVYLGVHQLLVDSVIINDVVYLGVHQLLVDSVIINDVVYPGSEAGDPGVHPGQGGVAAHRTEGHNTNQESASFLILGEYRSATVPAAGVGLLLPQSTQLGVQDIELVQGAQATFSQRSLIKDGAVRVAERG